MGKKKGEGTKTAMVDEDQAQKRMDANATRTAMEDRMGLRWKVRMFYDLQRLRLQAGGRTKKQATGVEIDLHPRDLEILENRSKELRLAERHALADVEAHLNTMSFYKSVLSDKTRYKGIGPTMAGVILSEFDIERQGTVSKMWAFAGLRPMPARRCKACHTVVEVKTKETDLGQLAVFVHVGARKKFGADEKPETKVKCPEYITEALTYESGKAQRPTPGQKLPYNAFLRTKLVGVLADVLIKLGSPWTRHYHDYKGRKAAAKWGRSDAHRHVAAKRYMIKQLLLDIWREWRTHLNLSVRPPYAEEYLGHKHIGGTGVIGMQEQIPQDLDPEVAAELEQANER